MSRVLTRLLVQRLKSGSAWGWGGLVWRLTHLARCEQAQETDGSQGFRATAQFRAADLWQSSGSERNGE